MKIKTTIAFAEKHSGDEANYGRQCTRHPSLAVMPYSQARAAHVDHLGTPVSRQWLSKLCDSMDPPVKRRRRHGPPGRSRPESRSVEASAERGRYEAMRADPERYQRYLDRKRAEAARRRAAAPA